MSIRDYLNEHQMIRMTTKLSIIIVGFISAIFGLSMLMQLVYGQVNNSQLYDQMLNNPPMDSRLVNLSKIENQLDNLNAQMNVLVDKKQSIETVVNYCFAHAERPNPIQDLIDKGFASEEYKNLTCKDVNLAYDTNKVEIATLQLKINQAIEVKNKEIERLDCILHEFKNTC
jgi:hypothetical protein